MANRYIAFGYEITEGKIAVIETEREIVANIYGMYINGHPFSEISNRLNQAGVSYNNDGRNWNKNMVKRILENKKYLGDGNFPQIIHKDTFDRAEEMRLSKSSKLTEDKKELNTLFRTRLVCGCCGERLDRYKGNSHNNNKGSYRRCKNPECMNPATSISEKDLAKAISGITNSLIRNPEQIKADDIGPITPNETEIRANFTDELNNPKNEIKDIVDSIIKSAELRFSQCTEQDYTAIDENIRKELSIRAEGTEIDVPLIKSMVKIMRLYPNKVIEMELINGNIFTGGIENDKCRTE